MYSHAASQDADLVMRGRTMKQPYRLGCTEAAILAAVGRAGGVMPRSDALRAVFPRHAVRDGAASASTQPGDHPNRRANAESAVTRAVASLKRKGLLVSESNPITARVMLRASDCTRLPAWEETARGEEDFAEYCRRQATAWDAFARSSLRRAVLVRGDRGVERTERERHAHLEEMRRLELQYRAAAVDGRRRGLIADMHTGDLGAA